MQITNVYLLPNSLVRTASLNLLFSPLTERDRQSFFPWHVCHHGEENGHYKTYIVGEMFDTEPTFQQQKLMSEHTSQRSNC